jgi:RNA polymerase sigma-70 factor (ECF subfamily)
VGCHGTDNDFDRDVAAEIPAVLRFAVRMTGDLESAEELVQESLYRAARNRDSFRGASSLRTWLFKIAIHCFRDGVAQRKRRGAEPIADDLPDPRQVEPDRASLDAELAERIAREVSNLPPRQREVLVLSVYEQLTPVEIAGVLDITVANVHVNLHHARERLKQSLAGYLAEK